MKKIRVANEDAVTKKLLIEDLGEDVVHHFILFLCVHGEIYVDEPHIFIDLFKIIAAKDVTRDIRTRWNFHGMKD